MSKSLKNKEPFLFLAGSWFAMAFSIPVLLLWMDSEKTFAEFIFFVLPPIGISFLCGEAFGSDLLKPNLIQNSKQALVKGLKIFLLSYGYFTPTIAVTNAVYLCLFYRDEHQWLTVQFIQDLFTGLFSIAFVGFLAFGWLLAILGALAGLTLYKFKLYQKIP